ncbi:hypothetical protein D3C81_1551380 [compost metagenome]
MNSNRPFGKKLPTCGGRELMSCSCSLLKRLSSSGTISRVIPGGGSRDSFSSGDIVSGSRPVRRRILRSSSMQRMVWPCSVQTSAPYISGVKSPPLPSASGFLA